jgi:hypothetical protein
MGLEPTTFCMAKAGRRSRPSLEFAEILCLQRLRAGRANASEPERTPSAATAAIVIVATSAWAASQPHAHHATAEARVTDRELGAQQSYA